MQEREDSNKIPLKAPHLALRDLVLDASRQGKIIRNDVKDHLRKIKEFYTLLDKKKEPLFPIDPIKNKNLRAGGVDGSFYPIQSFGNNWYIPFIIAVVDCRILNVKLNYSIEVNPGSELLKTTPRVDISLHEDTRIFHEIPQKIRKKASELMLEKEMQQLNNLLDKLPPYSTIFIDGPLIDPPVGADSLYIEKRCKIFRKALENDLFLIGVAKRINESYIAPNILKEFIDPGLEDEINTFCRIGDRSILGPLFNRFRTQNNHYRKAVATECFFMDDNETRRYQGFGLRFFSGSFQQSFTDLPIRLEILLHKHHGLMEARKIWKEAMRSAATWTYPKQKIPLPVILAHENCQVSSSLARVLHDEFLARIYDQPIEDILGIRSMSE